MRYLVLVNEHCRLPIIRETCRTLGHAMSPGSDQVISGMVRNPSILVNYEQGSCYSVHPKTYAMTPIEDQIEVGGILTIGTGGGSCTPDLFSPSVSSDHLHFIFGEVPVDAL